MKYEFTYKYESDSFREILDNGMSPEDKQGQLECLGCTEIKWRELPGKQPHTMTQLELLKYAYVGALETYEATKKMLRCSEDQNPDLISRLFRVEKDYEEIRDAMFAEIEKLTGRHIE